MKRKLGIVAECVPSMDANDVLPLLRQAGFETTFTGQISAAAVDAIQEKCAQTGITLEFLHGPWRGINSIWLPGEEYRPLYDQMRESIETAAASGVGVVVLHVSSGWTPPEINDTGLARFDALVELAEKKGAVIAFENLRKAGNVIYFTDRYDGSDAVRFCYDCGHAHCYTERIEFIDVFADRLICTHIHDNFGRDHSNPMADGDRHLLPFDGNMDYAPMMKKLDEYGYTGSLMLEVHQTCGDYAARYTPEEFIREAYERIRRVAAYSA